jgi:CrcB protein
MIAVGGALGSIVRYLVGSTIGSRVGVRFPYGTMVVNLTACLIIGFSLTFFSKRADVAPTRRFLVTVGFIGSYSTFSTFEWETFSELRSGAFALASAYALGSVAMGLVATWCGVALADAL